MSVLYPLRFHPILRRYLWGGRRLEMLGKPLGSADDYAESWEIVDHGSDQSVVAGGELAGCTLGELVRQHPRALLGRHAQERRFPLLFKFLDAHDRLSLQVHPDDARAARLDPPDLGKTEAWVILAAEPGSYLYAGLRPGIDCERFRRDVARNHCQDWLEAIQPRVGDCYFLPAGVVHALGPGLLVAEIQQASDTTYRLFDWHRLGPDGQPRALHIEAALEAIDYHYGRVAAQQPQPGEPPGVERLVACNKFILDRWKISATHQAGGDRCCHVLAVIDGALDIAGDPAGRPLKRGDVALLPAELGSVQVTARDHAVVLDAYLP
jgi:mannose-6-phosphate isomerase